jgi:virulence factor Mce-like protein
VITEKLNPARIFVVAAFALTCFGLLLFLWNAFGGTIPLKPKAYRLTIALPEADLLSTQADVRISGVTVGHVISTERTTSASDPNRKDAVLEIEHDYAPLHTDVKATIRRKSLAGEEYLELTPGSPRAPIVPDGGRLANANVAQSVEIDEVLRLFDEPTRRQFGQWMQAQALSIAGRGPALNAAFGNLPGFEQDLTRVLTTLTRQQAAVRGLVSNTGAVFDALSARRDQLQGLMTNGKRATDAFAAQSASFADLWRALPTFESESRKLLLRADRFRKDTDPVLTALRPGVRAFSAAMQEVPPTAHELDRLAHGVDGLTTAAKDGLPATRQFIDEVRPLTAELVPFLAQFQPLIGYIGENGDSLAGLVGNLTAATQATTPGLGSNDAPLHYARAAPILDPSMLAVYTKHKLPTSRSNAYPSGSPRFSATQPLSVLDERSCGPLVWPTLGPPDPAANIDDVLIERIRHFALNDDQPVASPCLLQRTPGGSFPQIKPLSHTPGETR